MINNRINKVDPSIMLVDLNKFQPADAKSSLGGAWSGLSDPYDFDIF